MKHESFVRRFIHHLGNDPNVDLDAGALKKIYDKHKPDVIGSLNFLINRGNHAGPSMVGEGGSFVGKVFKTAAKGAWEDLPFKNTINAVDSIGHQTAKAIGGNINEDPRLGGSYHSGGTMISGGSLTAAGSAVTGGTMYSGGNAWNNLKAGFDPIGHGFKNTFTGHMNRNTNPHYINQLKSHVKSRMASATPKAIMPAPTPSATPTQANDAIPSPTNPSGGSMRDDPFGINHHKDMYHHILSLSPAHWELYREKAAQLLGARPSPMWDHLPQLGNKELESHPENFQHIMRMPNTHAAARLLEAEAGSGHGGALKAFKQIHKALRPLYPSLMSEKLANLNPKLEAARLKSFLKPIAKSVYHSVKEKNKGNFKKVIIGEMKPEDAFHSVKKAFHGSVKEHLPSLERYVNDTLGIDQGPEKIHISHPAVMNMNSKIQEHPSEAATEMVNPVKVNNNPMIKSKDEEMMGGNMTKPSRENMSVPHGGAVRRPN